MRALLSELLTRIPSLGNHTDAIGGGSFNGGSFRDVSLDPMKRLQGILAGTRRTVTGNKRSLGPSSISNGPVKNTDDRKGRVMRIYDLLNEEINNTVKRSRYYPLPRDLCFPVEKPLFKKWARGKKNLVEIGIFEGASGALFRSVMDNNGVLHLIDPFVPDSGNPKLCARKWMAKLNILRVRNGHVKWYEDYSTNVVKKWEGEMDFLFIDGDHTEAACRRDWADWSKFVSVGGIVIFHDARFGTSNGQFWDGWQGPTKVVNELFRGDDKLSNWKIVDEAGTAVVVQRIA